MRLAPYQFLLAFNPDMPEQMHVMIIVVPSIIVAIAAVQLNSVLAVYWATSNIISAAQTLAVH